MAELPDRADAEAKLAREIGALLKVQMGRLLELLGDPPDLEGVTDAFWKQAAAELQAALAKHMQNVFLTNAQQLLEAQPIGVEWGLVNEGAAQWARGASFDLIRGLNQTSRRAVQEAVASFFEQQLTMADLRRRLAQVFGPLRADMIASTEVTRAAVEGERALVALLEQQGAPVKEIRWLTNRDELVCPICLPLDGMAREPGGYQHPGGRVYDRPPAHTRCRCAERHFF